MSDIQSIRFLYASLRQNPPKDAHVIIARTFDALDNSLSSIYNSVKQGSSSVKTAIFVHSSINVGDVSNYIPIISGDSFTPLDLSIVAVSAPTLGTLQLDIQQSTNLVTWNSILQSYAQLPKGVQSTAPNSSFSVSTIKGACWIRSAVVSTSDLTAKQVTLSLRLQ